MPTEKEMIAKEVARLRTLKNHTTVVLPKDEPKKTITLYCFAGVNQAYDSYGKPFWFVTDGASVTALEPKKGYGWFYFQYREDKNNVMTIIWTSPNYGFLKSQVSNYVMDVIPFD